MKKPTNGSNAVLTQQQGERDIPRLDEKVFTYRKALGMIRAAKFAANRFPFKDNTLRLVRNEQEWKEVEAMYGNGLVYRIDYLIGSRPNIDINPTNVKKDIPSFLQRLNKYHEMALLLLEYTEELVPRYAYDGGFSVLFLPYQKVILEVNGQGFDGRGVTSGRAVCDVFQIPWDTAGNAHAMSIETLLDLRTQHITPEVYTKQRQQRIKSMVSDDLSQEFLESVIPGEYKLPEEAVLDLVRNVIPRLAKQHQKIAMELGREVYAVHGNLVRGKAQVWEIFDQSCWERDSCLVGSRRAMRTMNYEREMLALNDENVAALYYLRVPRNEWPFLTLYGEEELFLELRQIAYDRDGYERIATLHELLIEQRRIVEDCWKLVDEGLAERARAVGDCITGRKTQTMQLVSSPQLDDNWKTDVLRLRIVHSSIRSAEDKTRMCPDDITFQRISELCEREKALGNKCFERFLMQEQLFNGKYKVERNLLGRVAWNRNVFLSYTEAGFVRPYQENYSASIHGYAKFLRHAAILLEKSS